MLVPVQKMDPYEHLRPFLPAPVHVMDLYEHLHALRENRIFTYKIILLPVLQLGEVTVVK